MKITYEFDTNHPDFYDNDNQVLYRIGKISDIVLCLKAMKQAVINLTKCEKRASILTSELEEKFWKIIKDYNIDFEQL